MKTRGVKAVQWKLKLFSGLHWAGQEEIIIDLIFNRYVYRPFWTVNPIVYMH